MACWNGTIASPSACCANGTQWNGEAGSPCIECEPGLSDADSNPATPCEACPLSVCHRCGYLGQHANVPLRPLFARGPPRFQHLTVLDDGRPVPACAGERNRAPGGARAADADGAEAAVSDPSAESVDELEEGRACSCGVNVPLDSKFCFSCGRSLEALRAASPSAADDLPADGPPSGGPCRSARGGPNGFGRCR